MGVTESSNTAPLHVLVNPIRKLVPTGPQYGVQSLEHGRGAKFCHNGVGL